MATNTFIVHGKTRQYNFPEDLKDAFIGYNNGVLNTPGYDKYKAADDLYNSLSPYQIKKIEQVFAQYNSGEHIIESYAHITNADRSVLQLNPVIEKFGFRFLWVDALQESV